MQDTADILVAIQTLPGDIVSGMKKLLKDLFIPEDGFLEQPLQDLKQKVADKFNMDSFTGLVEGFKECAAEKISIKGFLDVSFIEGYLPDLHVLFRAILYPLIIIADIRFVIWLIRGSTPIAGGLES